MNLLLGVISLGTCPLLQVYKWQILSLRWCQLLTQHDSWWECSLSEMWQYSFWFSYWLNITLLAEPELPPDNTGKYVYEVICKKQGAYIAIPTVVDWAWYVSLKIHAAPAPYLAVAAHAVLNIHIAGVTPVSYVIRNIGKGNFRMRYHYLGSNGTAALAQALKVDSYMHKYISGSSYHDNSCLLMVTLITLPLIRAPQM